jgi:nitrogen fixation NifU-like protein
MRKSNKMDNTYSKELMKHFKNPKFVKDIKDPSGVGEVGNIRCGDIMHLEIKVKNNKIQDIGFKTFGCPAAVAASDVVCEIAKGKTLKQAKKLKKDDVVKKLKGMPSTKVHCSVLGIDALKKAIEDYEGKNKVLKQ